MTLRDAIRAVYGQVSAPGWAAPNLDGLADVLRDLSWRPEGDVLVALPDLIDLAPEDARRLVAVLLQAVAETIDGPRPIRVTGPEPEIR
jgi:hypothetical protein